MGDDAAAFLRTWGRRQVCLELEWALWAVGSPDPPRESWGRPSSRGWSGDKQNQGFTGNPGSGRSAW